jgi:hypothetical protein
MLVKVTDIEPTILCGEDHIDEYVESRGIENIIGCISGNVYDDYVKWSKENKKPYYCHIAFSRKLCDHTDLRIHSMRINGKVCRVVIRPKVSEE